MDSNITNVRAEFDSAAADGVAEEGAALHVRATEILAATGTRTPTEQEYANAVAQAQAEGTNGHVAGDDPLLRALLRGEAFTRIALDQLRKEGNTAPTPDELAVAIEDVAAEAGFASDGREWA